MFRNTPCFSPVQRTAVLGDLTVPPGLIGSVYNIAVSGLIDEEVVEEALGDVCNYSSEVDLFSSSFVEDVNLRIFVKADPKIFPNVLQSLLTR